MRVQKLTDSSLSSSASRKPMFRLNLEWQSSFKAPTIGNLEDKGPHLRLSGILAAQGQRGQVGVADVAGVLY